MFRVESTSKVLDKDVISCAFPENNRSFLLIFPAPPDITHAYRKHCILEDLFRFQLEYAPLL